MKKQSITIWDILFRYILISLLGIGNLVLFYTILTPATTYLIVFLLNFFDKTTIQGNLILFNSSVIKLIPACVAGSAFYLLLILNLSTPNIKFNKRIKILILSFLALFLLNVSRITILALVKDTIYFNLTHLFFWYVLSTIFVVGIWIASIKIFNIQNIPIYDDLMYILKLTK